MTTSPRLTIVMPTRTARGYLAASVESALRNLRADDELLIVANGASAEYVAVLMGMAHAPARLIVLEQGGVALARNAGLREATGAFVLFLDDDDLLIDGSVEFLRRELEAHPTWNGVAGEVARFDDAHEEPGEQYASGGTLITPLRLLGQTMSTPGAVVLRTEVARRIGGFYQERAPTEDFDFWLRIAADAPLVGVSAPILRYRVHASAVSANALKMGTQALATFQLHARAYSARRFSVPMGRAATRFTRFYIGRLRGELRTCIRSGRWTTVPAILGLLARFCWLGLRCRVLSRVSRLDIPLTGKPATSWAAPEVPYRDQSTSKLEVAE